MSHPSDSHGAPQSPCTPTALDRSGYPGDTQSTPELEAAARASLDARGDESTGWSLAWKLALRACLGQATKVSDLLRLVFRDMTTNRGGQSVGPYPDLLAAHPLCQIDDDFGYVAGLVEALPQSTPA